MQSKRLLFAGSSQIRHSESPDQPSLPDLTSRRLEDLQPGTSWTPAVAIAYPLPNMAAQVAKALAADSPDSIVLFLGSSTFAEHKVEYSLRRRSRTLARQLGRASGRVLTAAGGGTEGSASPRGLLFRMPRSLARRIFGAAPLVQPDVALEAVCSTIARLQRERPGKCLVVLSAGAPQTRERADQAAATIRWFNERVAEYCEGLGVSYIDPVRAVEGCGVSFERPDGIHAGFETRRALSLALAERLDGILGGSEERLQGAVTHGG
jgi:hypothetical protein